MRKRLSVLTVMFAFTSLALGCASDGAVKVAATGGASGEDADTIHNQASSPSWLAVGEDIRKSRDEALSNPAIDRATISDFPPVLTEPVTIAAPGTYELIGGPVTVANTPSPRAVTLPLDIDEHGIVISQPMTPELSDKYAASYIRVVVEVKAISKHYQGLTAWFQ